jgi:drug/metabolite transporter (DMT)-like permease
LTIQVLFGINYVISKEVVDNFPPLVWASVRIIISSALMLTVALLSRRKHPTPNAKFFRPLIGYALLGIIINQASFLVGLHYTTAVNSAILNTLIPVFTLLIVTLRGQEQISGKRIVGFLCAFAGVLVIRKVEHLNFSDNTLIGDLLTILNCLSYAFFLSYAKRFLESHDRLWTTVWLFIYGSAGLTLFAIPQYATAHTPTLSNTLLACMAFSIIGGTLITYFLNLWTLAHTKSSSVALFIYLQPVVASLMAWAWKGDTITPRAIFSMGLIFSGMLLALSPIGKEGFITQTLATEPAEKTLQ